MLLFKFIFAVLFCFFIFFLISKFGEVFLKVVGIFIAAYLIWIASGGIDRGWQRVVDGTDMVLFTPVDITAGDSATSTQPGSGF